MTDLATRLRARRSACGWTLAAVASCTQVSISFVSDLENGRRKFTLGNAEAWASALGMNLEEYVAAVLQEKLAAAGLDYLVKVVKP